MSLLPGAFASSHRRPARVSVPCPRGGPGDSCLIGRGGTWPRFRRSLAIPKGCGTFFLLRGELDVDLTTGQSGNQIPLAGGGFRVGVTPDDHEAWIAIAGAGQVQVFNLQQRRITGSLNVGGDPRRLAFSALGKIGAVTNSAGYLTFVK